MTFTPILVGTGLAGYAYLRRTQDDQIARLAASAQPARDIAQFRDRIAQVQDVDDLMNDRALLRVALGAFGLDDDIANTAFIRRVLEGDPGDPEALVNRLADKRYLAFARSFNFAGTPRLPGADATAALRDELAGVPSVEALLADSALLGRALDAFDLGADRDRTVFLSRVLRSDPDDPGSLVNRLGDARYLGLARAFQDKAPGLSADFVARAGEEAAARLGALATSDDLLADRTLLRSALRVYGLEDRIGDAYFLKRVLDSDPDDPASFANALSDPRYGELARAFGFDRRAAAQTSVYGFAAAIRDRLDTLRTSDALLDDPDLLRRALDLFGLEGADRAFLKSVLDSDLADPASVANRQEDPRYRALAGAFDFGAMLGGTPQDEAQRRITRLIDAVEGRRTQPADPAQLFADPTLMVATMTFFDVTLGDSGVRYARAALDSLDPESPFAGTLDPDPRYRAFHAAMDFRPAPEGRAYPPGFAEAVTQAYLERQFELRVGEIDNTLRVALSFERDLGDVAARFGSESGRWFAVLSSQPLRLFFETSFGLPQNFGTVDVDRQVTILREWAERAYGTSAIGDLLADPARIEDMRRTFLAASQTLQRAQVQPFGNTSALTLFGAG
ncbi:DUF1217 domain-containing protein [Roseivivax isoporae]|uniref:Flagellar protein n=1 Tax=Roseivivax isoporae LMG 25204 TaxID=1449351 RepID=X7F4Y8_9RHOB|nr:DUF1217 domain-containing protein [Roseivivax isoporae]ETX27146.1 hypothetical protein RISW2_16405 [Roseivivax isoporae LMG 25204]